MQIIIHKRNTVEELKSTPSEYGIEMDIRSYGDRLVVHHNPLTDAVDFEEWIKFYKHRTLILNTKEEGIEGRVKEIVEGRGISDFFFLDLTFPFLIKMIDSGEKRVAVRFSEYESLETVLGLAGKAGWVWIDTFTKLPLDPEAYALLKERHFKLCLVCPERWGRPDDIDKYRKYLLDNNMHLDAVMTAPGYIDKWSG